MSISSLIQRLKELIIIDDAYNSSYNNVYQTQLKEYFNEEKSCYIYYTDLIQAVDFNNILDHINTYISFSEDVLMEIDQSISKSIIKIYTIERINATYGNVSVKFGTAWATFLTNEHFDSNIPWTIKESINVLKNYNFNTDYKRTFQQSLVHIENLESSVALFYSLKDLANNLNEVTNLNKSTSYDVVMVAQKKKKELTEIINGL